MKKKATERLNKLKEIGFIRPYALLRIDDDGDYFVLSDDLLEIDVVEMNNCGCTPDCRLYLGVSV